MEEKFNSSQDNFTTEKVNVISNCLFGNYINDQYIIADDIKDELVKVVKVKKSVFKNSVFCGSYIVGYGDVIFEVTFQKNTVKNVAKSELYVLENEYKINGYIQNTIRTKVGEYIDDLDNFIEKTYDFFNIRLTDNNVIYDKKQDPSINAYINAKKNFSLNMAKLTKKDYNKLYRNYVTARLELLKKANTDYSNTVLDKFNSEFSKIESYFLKENNYKALSELLDKSIEDVSGVNPKFAQDERQMMEKLVPVIDNFSKEADVIFEKAQPKAMNSLDREDKTRMEDIEREMYEYQQSKKVEKHQPQSSSDVYVAPSSAPSKEETKPQQTKLEPTTKVEKSQPSPTPDNSKTQENTVSTSADNTSATTLNQRPTTPIYPVNPTNASINTPTSTPSQTAPQSGQNPTMPQQSGQPIQPNLNGQAPTLNDVAGQTGANPASGQNSKAQPTAVNGQHTIERPIGTPEPQSSGGQTQSPQVGNGPNPEQSAETAQNNSQTQQEVLSRIQRLHEEKSNKNETPPPVQNEGVEIPPETNGGKGGSEDKNTLFKTSVDDNKGLNQGSVNLSDLTKNQNPKTM